MEAPDVDLGDAGTEAVGNRSMASDAEGQQA